MTPRATILVSFFLVVALSASLGCPGPREADSPEPDEARDDHEAQLRELMKKQLEAVDAIHNAVAFGELGKARESADWLAKNAMIGQVPDTWAAHVSAVQVSARKVSGGKKLGDIGEGLGTVLAACGGCHQSLGLALVASSAGEMREASSKQMRQHTFAMTLLEHGLLLPSEDLWEQGAVMIEAGSFDLSADPPTALDAKESDAIGAELTALGSEAAAAQSLASKGLLYGQMMSRCSACHDRSRQGDPR